MRNFLEIQELLKRFYSKNEVFIVPVLKFLLAFVSLLMVNGSLGYMELLDNVAIVLIVALVCSFLPNGFIILFAALFSLLHLYSLALEVAAVALIVFMVMFLMFFRFSPKDSLVILLTPMCFALRIPYVIPLSMGLVGTPASAVSVGCGVIVHYLFAYVLENAPTISALDADEATKRLRMVIDGMINNKAMIVTIAAFAITVIIVYIIRKMSIDYSWTVAMIAGAIINLVILLIGDLMYDTNMSIFGTIIGTVFAVLLTKGLQLFVFNVDYSRTEKVQFEDDEYYYYVKAVPKMSLATPEKTVKKINTQRVSDRTSTTRSTGNTTRSTGNTARGTNATPRRTVSVERTGAVRRNMDSTRVAEGNTRTTSSGSMADDYEEI